MERWSFEHLADAPLLDGLYSDVRRGRANTARTLARMAEVARRRLYLPMGFPSMKAFCVRMLHMSDDSAKKRIQVARKGWMFPVIFDVITDGRVHLTGMRLLVPFIDEENVHELIEAATHRTVREIELLLAERFPVPAPEEGVEELEPGAARHLRVPSMVKPIAHGKYLVQFIISEPEWERMQYTLQLMSHRNPNGDLRALHAAGHEALIEGLEKEKFGASEVPGPLGSSTGRYIPRAVARAVWERDGGQCAYVSPDGRRCECKWRLEYDHVEAFARGGETSVENLRLMCRAHNQYAAACTFGAEFMEQKRQEALATRTRKSEEPGAARHLDSSPGGALRHLESGFPERVSPASSADTWRAQNCAGPPIAHRS